MKISCQLFTFLFVPVVTLLMLSSCVKESNEENHYVRMKINGAWTTWNITSGELGTDINNPSLVKLEISAKDASQKNSLEFSIQAQGSVFQTGSYSSDNQNHQVELDYFKDVNTPDMKEYQIETAPSMPSSKYIINITAITATEIHGNLNGNYLYDGNSSEFLQITEGEFRVKRIK